jgi:hypothetical protein
LLGAAQGEAAVSASCGITMEKIGTQFVCSHIFILVKTVTQVQGLDGILFQFWLMLVNISADFSYCFCFGIFWIIVAPSLKILNCTLKVEKNY